MKKWKEEEKVEEAVDVSETPFCDQAYEGWVIKLTGDGREQGSTVFILNFRAIFW